MSSINNSTANSVSNATVTNSLVLTSVADSDCANTVATTFSNCTGNNCISSDSSASFAANNLLNQNISSWLDTDNKINEVGQAVLTETFTANENLLYWNWLIVEVVESTLNINVAGLSNTTRQVKYFDWTNNIFIKSEIVTFDTSGNATTQLNVATDTVIFAGYLGENPPITGSGIYGVTI